LNLLFEEDFLKSSCDEAVVAGLKVCATAARKF
jgi:hypothetical protein